MQLIQEFLFLFFQELDWVYNDVGGVMTESLMQGAEVVALKVNFFTAFTNVEVPIF